MDFQTFNFHNCFICLRGIKVAHFERVKSFGGLKGAPGETPENGRFYINWPFLGVPPGTHFRPLNPFTLSKCATFMSLKHIKQWRKLNVWKWDILKYAAHFGPVPLGQVRKLCSRVALFFYSSFSKFFLD